MEVIVRNAKQGALDSATITLTSIVSKTSKLLSHMNNKDTVKLTSSRENYRDIIKLLVALQVKLKPTN